MEIHRNGGQRIDPREVLYEKFLELGLDEGSALLIAVDAGGQGGINRAYLRLFGIDERALQNKILSLVKRFEAGEFGGFG
jgi:hypothetical protein